MYGELGRPTALSRVWRRLCLAEASDGRTVRLNRALAVANARLAAEIAVALRRMA